VEADDLERGGLFGRQFGDIRAEVFFALLSEDWCEARGSSRQARRSPRSVAESGPKPPTIRGARFVAGASMKLPARWQKSEILFSFTHWVNPFLLISLNNQQGKRG
jgi:hypothetical protein